MIDVLWLVCWCMMWTQVGVPLDVNEQWLLAENLRLKRQTAASEASLSSLVSVACTTAALPSQGVSH
jgi:hypothetical protein